MGKRRKRKIEKLADYYLAPAREALAAACVSDAAAMIKGLPKAQRKLLDPRTINRRARRLLKSRLAMLDARS